MSDIEILCASLIGLREDNEDVEATLINMDTNGNAINKNLAPVDIFIICDGHGGKKVASLVCPCLLRTFENKKYSYPLSKDIINDIYEKIQVKLSKHPDNVAYGCGCTALVVIRYYSDGNKFLQVINSGDCRAVLSKKGLAIAMTKDHKPDWPDEKIRIMEVIKKHRLNSKIEHVDGAWRIGDLSVSKSFGDLDNTPCVTHIPEIFNYKINQYLEFIVMGCDGLWDVVSNEEAINFVKDFRINNLTYTYTPYIKGTINKNIAEKLAQYAINKGSTDNISIIIIFLNI